ncbi:MAG: lipopolysaccharide biosynthesis protein [Crocinitomicaceae bacterium]
MGFVQKDALKTMITSYLGVGLGYLNKAVLFVLILSTEEIGLMNLLLSVGLLFAQFANLGTFYTIWKFFPYFKNRNKGHFGFLPLMLLIVTIGIVIFTFLALLFQSNIQELYIKKSPLFSEYFIWIIPIGIAYVFFLVFEIYLRSLYKNLIAVIVNEILLRLLLTLLLVLVWFKIIDFKQLVIFHSLSYLIPTLILVFYLNKIDELHFSFKSIQISNRFKKIIIQFSAINYINTLGYVLVTSLDLLMVSQMLGLKAAGVYSTMIFMVGAIIVPYKSIHRVSIPLISDYWKHRDMEKMQKLYIKFSSVSLVIGLIFFLLIWLNIDPLFSFLPPEFIAGKWIFFFLMFGKLIDMYCGLNGSILVTSKKYKFESFFTLLLVAVVYVLNLLLLPIYGAIGAAISTLIALFLYNAIRLFFVAYHFKMIPFSKNQLPIILLGILTIFVGNYTIQLSGNPIFQLVIQTTLTVVLFLAPLYYLKLEKETVGFIKKILKKVQNKLHLD